MAHMSRDPVLVEAFRDGEDIHTRTAAEVMGVPPMMVTREARNNAKAVNFGIVYGISPFGLAAQLGISRKEAETYISNYFERYSGVRNFHRRHHRAGAPHRRDEDSVRPRAPHPGYEQPQSRTRAASPSAPRSIRRCRAPPRT